MSDNLHALDSFDTDAIAVSSMYKLAFPYATPDEEAAEMAALEKKYDTRCANGGLKTDYVVPNPVNDDGTPGKRGRGRPKKELRTFLPDGSTGVILQGTWIPAKNAHRIAKEYGLTRYAQPLIDARAAQFDRKPYFVDKNGKPVAAANGAELQPHQIDEMLAGNPFPTTNKEAGQLSSPASASAPLVNGAAAAAAAAAHEATGSAPVGKRARMDSKLETDGSGQKRVSTTATSVVTNKDGSTTLHTTKHTAEVSGKTAKEIEEDIAKSKEIAKRAQEEALAQNTGTSTAGGKKRRAQNAPSAEIDAMADDEDYQASQGRNVLTRTIRRGTTVVRRRPVATSATAVAAVGVASAAAAAFFNPASLDLALQAVQNGVANLQGWFF